MSKRDPRRIITPDAFTVAPDLLGIALARPIRRLLAISIDGILIAILSHLAGTSLLALVAGILLWRASARRPDSTTGTTSGTAPAGPRPGLARTGLRIASILAISGFIAFSYGAIADRISSAVRDRESAAADSSGAPGTEAKEAVDPCTSEGGFRGDDEIDLEDAGLSLSDVRDLPLMLAYRDAADSAAAAPLTDSIAKIVRSKPDSAHTDIASALLLMFPDAPGRSAMRASLAPFLPADTAALDENAGLRAKVETLTCQKEALEKKYNDSQKGFSMKKLLQGLSNILGFGFGWSALYFTAFTLLLRGQTPGKMVFGLRVIRLDGRPITGWISFERFGGYAASAAIGLLGFAQILWDRNRQALHDKATETVVIQEHGGAPVRLTDARGAAATL
jgi:uncharacterized RDD family membrane protein YckC